MSPEWGKYDQAKADADIAVHAALTTGVHGVGAGVVVGTTLTQTLTNKTLTSPVIQGTVTAGTGLTMPAFIAAGDITLGANKLILTHGILKGHGNADTMVIYNDANTDLGNIYIGSCLVSSLSLFTGAGGIQGGGSDGSYVKFLEKDTGIDNVEVARLQGAADPYFQATLPMRLLPVATVSLPGTPVEGMLAYDDTANKLKFYNGAAWETVTSAV